MNAIISIIIVLTLSTITYMQTAEREKRTKRRAGKGELAYLYAYRDLLKKAEQIEACLEEIKNPVELSTGKNTYFNPVEVKTLEQQLRTQIKDVIKSFELRLITAPAAQTRLNELNSRMQVLFLKVAA